MLNGGHIAGWAVEDPALIGADRRCAAVPGQSGRIRQKVSGCHPRDPLTLAVGDCNHSLATAKACWEELKKTHSHRSRQQKPSGPLVSGRDCGNVHSPAIEIEPIHRVLFNGTAQRGLPSLIMWSDSTAAGCSFGGSKRQPFTLAGPHMSNVLSFEDPTAPLTVGTIDEFIEYLLSTTRKPAWTMCTTSPRAPCAKKVLWHS